MLIAKDNTLLISSHFQDQNILKNQIKMTIGKTNSSLLIYIQDFMIERYSLLEIQEILQNLYLVALEENPFISVSIIFESICGYDVLQICNLFDYIFVDTYNMQKKLKQNVSSQIILLEQEFTIHIDNIQLKHTIISVDNLVVGGTFDHLHSGHKVLLSICGLIASQKIVCGITTKTLLNSKKYNNLIESFENRCDNVKNFLKLFKSTLDVEIHPLYDIYGPAININIDAIVISEETIEGAKAVNRKRRESNMKELDVYIIPMFLKISSTTIREHIHNNL